MPKQIISTLAGLGGLVALGGYIIYIAGDALTSSVKFLVGFATVVLAAALLLGLLAWAWIAFERARTESERRLEAQARRRLAERKAEVMVVVANHDDQVHIRELNREVSWRPAHLDQRLYANGQSALPTQVELASWLMWRQSRAREIAPLAESTSDLALAPGTALLAELPSLVRWSELVPQLQGDLHRLILGIRVDERGQLIPVTISLYELFHTLVAASSGWGKSVFANSLLSQLATCPQPVELVLIDQQDHGLAAFRQCDRLRYPLLRQPEEILGALQEVHEEAVRYRSELFARYDADDLAEYNRRADQFLPPIVVAVDEASALLAYKEIGAELKRHAWELRKFGVYQILLLTSAKGVVIDTDHRQQFASKVQLHANERTQARLLLDAPEATTFPPGRAVVELPGLPPTIIQTPYIDKREVRALLRPAGSPPPPPASVAEPTPAELAEQEKDRLFKQRVEAGLSRNAASLEAYGRRYAGDLVERGKRILGER
jgi:membrane protein implicated in regulation of membrane protease activity